MVAIRNSEFSAKSTVNAFKSATSHSVPRSSYGNKMAACCK